jgi:DNA-binding response OmpR family regulator
MPKKILVIEDDKFLRKLLIDRLAEEGYFVDGAIDGEEGMKKAKTEEFDLILLDLILPGIDGFEVLSFFKKEKNLEKIPVIILSNLGQREEVERGLKLGAVDYIIKAHFTLSEIVEKIKKFLRKDEKE